MNEIKGCIYHFASKRTGMERNPAELETGWATGKILRVSVDEVNLHSLDLSISDDQDHQRINNAEIQTLVFSF